MFLNKNDEKILKKIELSPKRENFCQELIIDDNQTQAAIRAGYANRSAEQQGSKLMSNSKVKARVDQLRAERLARQEKKADDVIRKLWDILNFNPKQFLKITQEKTTVTNYDGSKELKKVSSLNIEDWESLPGELITEIKLDKNGNPCIKFVSKETALRLIKEIYFNIEAKETVQETNITFGVTTDMIKSLIKNQNEKD